MSGAQTQDEIADAAAAWHARIDGDDMDWAAFADWIADPACRDAYDRVAILDAEIRDAAPAIVARLPANDDETVERSLRRRSRVRWWTAGGLAAAALAALTLTPGMLPTGAPASTAYRTGPGETRTVALADGSSIRMDRNTALSVADGGERRVEMASGAAYFDVRHDPDRPFVIATNGYEVRDVGTQFDVVRDGARLSVAVAQGEVAVTPSSGHVTSVTAGRRLDVIGDAATVRRVDPADVAAWRDGRLIYDNAPLMLVAADIARYDGRNVTVDPRLSGMRFSGVLTIGDGSGLVEQIQEVLPLRARIANDRVRLVGVRAR